MNTHVEIELTVRGTECTVLAEGCVLSGGSYGYGSDEAPWTEVDDIELTHVDGRTIRKATVALILKEHASTIQDELIASLEW